MGATKEENEVKVPIYGGEPITGNYAIEFVSWFQAGRVAYLDEVGAEEYPNGTDKQISVWELGWKVEENSSLRKELSEACSLYTKNLKEAAKDLEKKDDVILRLQRSCGERQTEWDELSLEAEKLANTIDNLEHSISEEIKAHQTTKSQMETLSKDTERVRQDHEAEKLGFRDCIEQMRTKAIDDKEQHVMVHGMLQEREAEIVSLKGRVSELEGFFGEPSPDESSGLSERISALEKSISSFIGPGDGKDRVGPGGLMKNIHLLYDRIYLVESVNDLQNKAIHRIEKKLDDHVVAAKALHLGISRKVKAIERTVLPSEEPPDLTPSDEERLASSGWADATIDAEGKKAPRDFQIAIPPRRVRIFRNCGTTKSLIGEATLLGYEVISGEKVTAVVHCGLDGPVSWPLVAFDVRDCRELGGEG